MASYGSISTKNTSNGDGSFETDPLISANGFPKVERRSIWSRLLFAWFTPILEKGNEKQRLDQEDLELVPFPADCTTDHVLSNFDKYWNEELTKENPSLQRAMYHAFGAEYIRAGVLKLVHDLCLFVGPQVLHSIIVFVRSPDAPLWHGVFLTVAVTCSQLLMSLCLRHYFFKCYSTGLRVRTAVVVAVYRKAVKLSAGERQKRSLGEITNLMSIDAQRLQDLTTYLHSLWSSPLQIALALYFLWRQLGPSSLGGVSVIFVIGPVTKYTAQWMASMQKKLMRCKDARVELNGEVLGGMKVIKFQAWEESFQDRILALREAELTQLFRYYIASSFTRLLWVVTPLLVALATFAAYVWSGHQLDVASALTALALFDILRFPLAMLPRVVNSTVEAMVSVNRICSFLLCEEHDPIGPGSLEDVGIHLDGVSAVYETKRPKFSQSEMDPAARNLADKDWEIGLLKAQLKEAERKIKELADDGSDSGHEDSTGYNVLSLSRVDFKVRPGQFIAVVGNVGCGKSTLLNAILGELRSLCGSVSVKGRLAYFSQSPFILNASVRDNILFGHIGDPVDEDLYQRAVASCALNHDLSLLSNGDETEIGEKGITLSGGQKARVALARAVYHSADITLIDDALSAVDAHVAKHLFEKAILGELLKPSGDSAKPRSVVLVTNALQYLKHPRVDKIVVIQEGRIVEQGSYEELVVRKSIFYRYLAAAQSSEVKDGTEQDHEAVLENEIQRDLDGTAVVEDVIEPLKKQINEEVRASGHVDFKVYLAWARAAGGTIAVPIAVLFIFSVGEFVSVLSNWWLTYWSGHGNLDSQGYFLTIYALIGLGAGLAGFVRMILLALFSLRASRQLFARLLGVVLHAPMSFFDVTPVGRLVNRFSKDIYTIDEQIIQTVTMYLGTMFNVFSTIVVISGVTPVFTLCLIPMLLFYVNEQRYFTVTYSELKRLDSVNRSPLYALLGESVDGVAVIRAFSAQPSLYRRLVYMLNIQQHAYYLTCTGQSWLAVRLELIGTLIITFACLSAVLERSLSGANPTFAGLAGLAISYALSVTQSLNWSVRMASDMEANMVAVERVEDYSSIRSEGDRHSPNDKNLADKWPSQGEIVFKGAKLRYREELPLVLKGLDLTIPPGCKVGVVGRTGAGKSTLMVALMRIVELDAGQIFVDGQDTRLIGLACLRRNIAVIPQDPVLFSGSVRSNLDPFDSYSDQQLYDALDRVGLYKGCSIGVSNHSVSSTSYAIIESLDEKVLESGSNFSVGQRQLLVIARALLRGASIVIMDEATAAVDAETDAKIQRVMREEFSKATCITIAHRLNTIMDCDYILVMSDGRAAEFDTPQSLMQRGGMFKELVKAASRT